LGPGTHPVEGNERHFLPKGETTRLNVEKLKLGQIQIDGKQNS
jgi:hypothetical protein